MFGPRGVRVSRLWSRRRGGFAGEIHERDRRLVANCAVWSILVVSAPSLQFFSGVGKRQEQVSVEMA